MAFRIGVNLGDVVVEGDRIYGDGVNIAARVEALALPGGICVSAKVHDEVRRKLALAFEDLGEHELKNIAALGPGLSHRQWRSQSRKAAKAPAATGQAKPSIIVLPFTNMSGARGAGILRRRPDRGHPHRPVALPRAVRHLAQHLVQVQGPGGGREEGRARARRALRRRGQRAQGRQPGAHHGAADRRPSPTTTSGPSATTGTWRTSSRSRTRSPRPSSPRCRGASRPTRAAAPSASRPANMAAYECVLEAKILHHRSNRDDNARRSA